MAGLGGLWVVSSFTANANYGRREKFFLIHVCVNISSKEVEKVDNFSLTYGRPKFYRKIDI